MSEQEARPSFPLAKEGSPRILSEEGGPSNVAAVRAHSQVSPYTASAPASARDALRGLTAVITGGSKGIGLAIAHRLAGDGASVAIIGRDLAALERIGAELNARHAAADVTDETALTKALELLGPCDVLVNNAGAAVSRPFLKHSTADFRAMFELNLISVVTACRFALPAMRLRGFGRIVNIASTAGLRGYAYVSAYVAAKHALVGFTRALALETVRDGITVNAVCPGYTETAMFARSVSAISRATGRSEAEARAALANTNPSGRLIAPDEVAASVAFLCRRDSGAITGQAVPVACGEI